MIVLNEIAGGDVMKGALKRHRVNPVPLEAGQLLAFGVRLGFIVVFDVPCMDQEIRSELPHHRIDLVAVLRIVPSGIVLTGNDGKKHGCRCCGIGGRLEASVDCAARPGSFC